MAVRMDSPEGGGEYRLGSDQTGTIKVVADAQGRLIQYIKYDSFGNVLDNTNPTFRLPLGFAGGLADRDTGLVRFGYRDYDPAVGRFTAPDPMGDTGGDHDPWEYCVDDPVNAVDPLGLQPTQQGGDAESDSIFSQIGQWVNNLIGDTETPKTMRERDTNADEKWDTATDQLNTAGSGGEGALIDQIYQSGVEDNWDAMSGNADDAVESLGPNLIKLPGKATPRHRP